MKTLRETLDLHFLFKSLEPDYNYSKYEARIINELNMKLMFYYYQVYSINPERVLLIENVNSLEEFSNLNIYEDALNALIKTLKDVVKFKTPLEKFNKSGLYDGVKLDLSSVEKINLVNKRVIEASNLGASSNPVNMHVALDEKCPLSLIYIDSVLKVNDLSKINATYLERNNIYMEEEFLYNMENVYITTKVYERVVKRLRREVNKKENSLLTKYKLRYYWLPILISIIVIVISYFSNTVMGVYKNLNLIVAGAMPILVIFFYIVLPEYFFVDFDNKRHILKYDVGFLSTNYKDMLVRNPNKKLYDFSWLIVLLTLGIQILIIKTHIKPSSGEELNFNKVLLSSLAIYIVQMGIYKLIYRSIERDDSFEERFSSLSLMDKFSRYNLERKFRGLSIIPSLAMLISFNNSLGLAIYYEKFRYVFSSLLIMGIILGVIIAFFIIAGFFGAAGSSD